MDRSLPLRTSFWMISHRTSPLAITNSSKHIRWKGHKTSRKPCRQLKPPNTTAMGPAADGCRPWGLPMLPKPQKQAPKPWLSLLPAGQLLQVHLRSFGEAQVFLRWPGRGSLGRNTGDLDVTWWSEIKHSCHRPHIHSNYDSNPYVILLVPTETLGLFPTRPFAPFLQPFCHHFGLLFGGIFHFAAPHFVLLKRTSLERHISEWGCSKAGWPPPRLLTIALHGQSRAAACAAGLINVSSEIVFEEYHCRDFFFFFFTHETTHFQRYKEKAQGASWRWALQLFWNQRPRMGTRPHPDPIRAGPRRWAQTHSRVTGQVALGMVGNPGCPLTPGPAGLSLNRNPKITAGYGKMLRKKIYNH